MTAANHTLAGIGLATVVNNPFLLVTLAFSSHFVLDALPHFGMPGTKYKSKKFMTWLMFDIALMLCVIGAALFYLKIGFWYVMLGVGGAVLPDIMHINKLVGEKIIFPQFQAFHAKIQWYEQPKGVVGELAFGIVLAKLIF